jgi:hypothetical protein
MENLKSIYIQFNDLLDSHEKGMNNLDRLASETIRKMITDKNSYTEMVTDDQMNMVEAIYTNMVNAMVKSENVTYIPYCSICGTILDALFFKGDFELLDLLRSSKPFNLLKPETKDEIMAILELFSMYDVNEATFFGNEFYQYYNKYNLPKRETIQSLSRKFKGIAA